MCTSKVKINIFKTFFFTCSNCLFALLRVSCIWFFLNLDIRIYNLAFETNNGYPKQQYRLPKLYYSTDFSIIMWNNFFSTKKCSINKKCWPFRHEMDFFNVSLLLWFSISFWCLVRTLLLKTLKWLKMRLTLLINYCLLCA